MKQWISAPLAGGVRVLASVVIAAIGFAAPSVRAQVAQGTGGGTALSFDGVNGFARISNSAALNPYPLTVMGWFRSSLLSGERVFFATGPSGGLKMGTVGSQLRFT